MIVTDTFVYYTNYRNNHYLLAQLETITLQKKKKRKTHLI